MINTTTNPHNMRLQLASIECKINYAEGQAALAQTRMAALVADRDALVAALAKYAAPSRVRRVRVTRT